MMSHHDGNHISFSFGHSLLFLIFFFFVFCPHFVCFVLQRRLEERETAATMIHRPLRSDQSNFQPRAPVSFRICNNVRASIFHAKHYGSCVGSRDTVIRKNIG